ncbi:MAG: GGDEF domain-containing protein [Treponema sp.]|nr:GGDEF domain-containing protein [Treponema sp.]
MEFVYFVEANALSLMLGLWLALTVKKEGSLRASNQIFFRMAICTTVVLALEAACSLVNGRPGNSFYIANIILNAVRLILAAYASQTWLLYTLHFLRPKQTLPRRIRKMIFIPFLIVAAFVALSVFTRWVFYVDKYTNLYTRGKFCFIHMIATYGYFGNAANYALIKMLRSRCRYSNKMCCTNFLVFVVMPVASGAVNLMNPYLNIIWVFLLISLFLIFTRVQFSQIVLDGLTGVNNRNCFDNYLYSISTDKPFSACLFMMDINSFKEINDSFGHPEGDQALEQTAKIISQIFKDENCMIARYGGDEFAVLAVSPEPFRKVDANAEALRLALYKAFAEYNSSSGKPYELTVSVGYAFMIGRDEVDAQQLIKASDSDLYREKQRVHSSKCL